MIKIRKKDALLSYISFIVSQLSNIAVLPLILNKVSDQEYALWSIFISVQAFVIMFDFGFAKIVARYTTYAFCGAEKIPEKGLPQIKHNKPVNTRLMSSVLNTSKSVYKWIAAIASITLLFFSLYIYKLALPLGHIYLIMCAWVIFSSGVVISLYFTYPSSFIKGLGKIKEIQEINISSDILSCVLKVLLILNGWGLLGLGVAYTMAILYKRFRFVSILKNVMHELKIENIIGESESDLTETKELKRAFYVNTKELGIVVVTQYLQSQGTTLICSVFLSLAVTAQYGLTTQFLGILGSLISIPVKTYQPVLNEYQIKSEKEKLKNLFSVLTVEVWIIYWIGTSAVFFLLPPVLELIGSNTNVLDGTLYWLTSIYIFIVNNHQRATDFIGLGNRQPYVKAYLFSSICSLIITAIVFTTTTYGLAGFLVVNVGIQLLYNAWKWPLETHKLTDLDNKQIIKRGVREIIRTSKNVMALIKEKDHV